MDADDGHLSSAMVFFKNLQGYPLNGQVDILS